MTGQLVGPDAPEWFRALRTAAHDLHHEPAYAVLDARLAGGAPAAFHYTEDGRHLLLPLIVRDIPGAAGLRDMTSPYGYPAPVADTPDPAFWERACAALLAAMRAERIVTAFVRMHPLLDAPLPVLRRFGTLVHHGETVSCDLRAGPDEMWRETRRDHRNHINRARRDGTKVVIDDWSRLAEWIGVYHDNMRRLGAAPYYFFTAEHLAALRAAAGDRLHLAVALEGDEVVGGNTFFEHQGIATGYLASTRRARHRFADELLYDEARRFCRARGNRVFHFGGGKGGANDSLFFYKAGFAAGRHPFHTWRVVADPDAVRELMRGRPWPDTFPPYR